MDPEQALINERLSKLKEIKSWKINPYPYKYSPTHHADQIKNSFAGLKPEEKTKETVCVAGRLLTKRDMGKIAFATVSDQSGTIQLFAKEDLMKDSYKLFRKVDLGDFVGAKGIIFKTKSGEITVEVKEFILLSKSLRPLPEKYHGLQDQELKYRQRYLDLALNPEVRNVFRKPKKLQLHKTKLTMNRFAQ